MPNGNTGESDPNIQAISGLSFWIALIAAGYLMLEKWAEFRAPVTRYLIEKIPRDWLDLALIAAPWVAGIVLLYALKVVISSVLSRLYLTIQGG